MTVCNSTAVSYDLLETRTVTKPLLWNSASNCCSSGRMTSISDASSSSATRHASSGVLHFRTVRVPSRPSSGAPGWPVAASRRNACFYANRWAKDSRLCPALQCEAGCWNVVRGPWLRTDCKVSAVGFQVPSFRRAAPGDATIRSALILLTLRRGMAACKRSYLF